MVTTSLSLRLTPPHAVFLTLWAAFVLLGAAVAGATANTLGVVLWLAGYVVLGWASVIGLFAEREAAFNYDFGIYGMTVDDLSRRHGGVSLGRFPPLYPRNIPVFTGVVAAVYFWTLLGLAVITPVSVVSDLRGATLTTASVAAVGLTLAIETRDVYFGRQQFADINVHTPIRRALELLFVSALLIGLSQVSTEATGQQSLLIGGGWAGYWLLRQRPGKFDHWTGRIASALRLSPDPQSALDPPVSPEGRPQAAVRTSQSAVWRCAIRTTVTADALLPIWILVFLGGGLAMLFGATSGLSVARSALIPVILAVPLLVLPVAPVKIAEYLFTHGTVEYRVYDHHLAAYDPILEATQWTLPLADVAVTSANGNTVTVETGGTTRVLRHISEPDRLVTVLPTY
jgi:hypothetical protein